MASRFLNRFFRRGVESRTSIIQSARPSPPIRLNDAQRAALARAIPQHDGIPNRRLPASAFRGRGGEQGSIAGAAWPIAFNTYEALAVSDDRTPISTIAVGPYFYAPSARFMFAPSVSYQRNRLAAISRYLYDNFTPVGYAVDMVCEFGTPVHPESASLDADWNKLADDYFNNWAEIADYSGRFSFWELQKIASKCIDLDGDLGFSMTNKHGFPQIQTIEGWRIGVLQQFPDLEVIDGVVLDPEGVVTGFVVQGDLEPFITDANNFCLLWDPDRFHSYRGVSALRRGANDIRDQHDILGFAKKRTKVGEAVAMWMEGGPMEEDIWGDNTGKYGDDPSNPNDPYLATGNVGGENEFGAGPLPPTQQQKQIGLLELYGGDTMVLPQGQTAKILENKTPAPQVLDLLDELAGSFVQGMGIPKAFFLDSKLTGPNVRSVLGKAQKRFDARSAQICKLAKWVRSRVIADAIVRRQLPAIAAWDKIKPRMPKKLVIDLGDESTNDRADVLAGQMSRQERWGKRSMNWDKQLEQIDAELEVIFEQAEAKAKKFNIPIETVLQAFGVIPVQQGGAGGSQNNKTKEEEPEPAAAA